MSSGGSSQWNPAFWVPTKLATAEHHTVAVSETGAFFGFGWGKNGELGHEVGFLEYAGGKIAFSLPEIENVHDIQIACGASHTLICADGWVYSTGSSDKGRLGHSKTHGMIAFPGKDRIAFISCGSDFSIAISEDRTTLYSWGSGRFGVMKLDEHGDLPFQPRPQAFSIMDDDLKIAKRITQIACGERHCIAICSDGQVYSWGSGTHGRLGHGGTNDIDEPRLIEKFLGSVEERIVQVAAGGSHSMALNLEGRVFTWGSGSYGRLGLGAEIDQYLPTMVGSPLRESVALSISCNAFHSLAIVRPAADNVSCYIWGDGKYGKLGLGDTKTRLIPTKVPGFSDTQVIKGVCGLHHTVLVTQQSQVFAFGFAANARLGQLTRQRYLDKAASIEGLKYKDIYKSYTEHNMEKRVFYKALDVACGDSHSLVLCEGNKVVSWGANSEGQLGTGRQAMSSRPVLVHFPAGNHLIDQVACGFAHSIARTTFGNIFTWGRNSEGQLGLGDKKSRDTPCLVKALQGTSVDSVHAGYYHSVAIEQRVSNPWDKEVAARTPIPSPNVKLYVWGCNTEGQLGLGKENYRPYELFPVPLAVPLHEDADGTLVDFQDAEVALGESHTFILGKIWDDDGQLYISRLYVTGMGQEGQLGLFIDLSSKVYEPTLVDNVSFSALSETKDTEGLEEKIQTKSTGRGCSMWSCDGSSAAKLGNTTVGLPMIDIALRQSTDYPLITRVYAGRSSSMCVISEEDRLRVMCWGKSKGLFPGSQPSPVTVKDFEDKHLNDLLDQGDIYGFKVLQIACGSNHHMLLARYKGKLKALFTWGETKFGKLGIGNIPEFMERRKKEQLEFYKKKKTPDDVIAAEQARQGPNIVTPALVENINDMKITQIATFSEHCVLVSDDGCVYSFGYGDSGRLGLGGDGGLGEKKSETTPTKINCFGPLDNVVDEKKEASAMDHIDLDGDAKEPDQDVGERTDFNMGDHGDIPIEDSDDEQENQERLREQIEPHLRDYRRLFQDYASTMNEIDRQRDLVNAAIVDRIKKAKSFKGSEIKWKFYMDQEAKQEAALRSKATIGNRKVTTRRLLAENERKQNDDTAMTTFHEEKGADADDVVREKKADLSWSRWERPSTGILSQLELLVSRLYLRPCLMLKLFQMFKIEVSGIIQGEGKNLGSSAKGSSDKADVMCQDFADFVFSIWDVNRTEDCRLLKVFLSLILTAHLASEADSTKILHEKSLEWYIYKRVFTTGKQLRILGDLLAEPMNDLCSKPFEDPHPIEAFRTCKSSPQNAFKNGHLALIAIVERHDRLFDAIVMGDNTEGGPGSGNLFKTVMRHMGPWLELLYRAISISSHKMHPLLATRVMKIIGAIILEDWDYQEEKRQREFESRRPTRRMGGQAAADQKGRSITKDAQVLATADDAKVRADTAETMKLVVYRLMSDEDFKGFVKDQYQVQESHIETNWWLAVLEKVGSNIKAPEKMLADKRCFQVHIEGDIKSRRLIDPRLGPVDVAERKMNQDIFRDFILSRSCHKRRVTTLSVRSISMLQKFYEDLYEKRFTDFIYRGIRLGNVNPDIQDADDRVVVRLDLYHADWNAPIANCSSSTPCGLSHAHVKQIDGDARRHDHKTRDEDGSKRIHDRECLIMFKALSTVPDVLRSATGDAAWKEVEDRLRQKRIECHARGSWNMVGYLETALVSLRKIKEMKSRTRRTKTVYFGDDPETVAQRVDVIDPHSVFQLVELVYKRKQHAKQSNSDRSNQLNGLVKALEDDVHDATDSLDYLRDSYRHITSPRSSATELRNFISNFIYNGKPPQGKTVSRLMEHLNAFPLVKVNMQRGAITNYSYFQLSSPEKGVLFPLSGDVRTAGGCCGCWYRMVFCCCFCCPGALCVEAEGENAVTPEKIEFLRHLEFVFVTTEQPDIFQLQITYKPGGASGLHILKDENISLSWLANVEKTDTYGIDYDPTGDHVPITEPVVFTFSRENLRTLLNAVKRPRQTLKRPEQTGLDYVFDGDLK